MSKSLHTLGMIACGMKIAAGTAFYFILKIMGETKVEDPNTGKLVKWDRPFFNSALLFFGMSFTMIAFLVLRNGKPGVTKLNKQAVYNMLIPTVLEFIGQVMFMMGSAYLPMSLSLTLKGARVVFSALLLVLLLGRKLFAFHWAAVTFTIVGLAIASIPALLKPTGKSKSTTEALIGISLVLGGEFIRSTRTVVEEKLMKKMRYDAMLVVGLQGVMALCLTVPTLFIVSQIQSNGKPLESIDDTWTMFSSNPIIYALALTFPITVSGLFISGAYVTKLMSAVHNALTTIITNMIVWILAIIVHYIDHNRGEKLTTLSLVQLLGFAIVLTSSLAYDSILRFPFFTYPLDRAAASGAGSSEKSVLGITESSDNISEVTTKAGDVVVVSEDVKA